MLNKRTFFHPILLFILLIFADSLYTADMDSFIYCLLGVLVAAGNERIAFLGMQQSLGHLFRLIVSRSTVDLLMTDL